MDSMTLRVKDDPKVFGLSIYINDEWCCVFEIKSTWRVEVGH